MAVTKERIAQLVGEGYTAQQAAEIASNEEGSNRVTDFNGWFEVPRNPISRVGVFPYLGESLGADIVKENNLDPSAIYYVLRPAEELSDPAFLESVKLVPWVNDHTMLGGEGTGYMPAEDKGIGGVTGEQVEFDEESGILYSNIKLFSEAHRDQVDSGKRELSLGYRCQYQWNPGNWDGKNYDLIQRNLRGNHLASVDEGRMGPGIAVLDHNDIKGNSAMDELLKLLTAAVAQLQKMKDEAAGADPDAPVSVDEDPAATEPAPTNDEDPAKDPAATDEDPVPGTDVEEPTAGTDEDPAPAAATDEDPAKAAAGMDAAINQRVNQRFKDIQRGAALATKLKPHVGVFDHSGKTEQEIAAYGVKKLGISATKGQEIPMLAGFLQGRGDPSKQPVARNGHGQDAAVKSGPSLMEKKLAERGNA